MLRDARIAGGAAADIVVAHSGVIAVEPPRTVGDLPAHDCQGGLVWPGLADCHTHLDKGHIWPRSPNPDGSFPQALATVAADRAARWTAADVRARFDFGLRCAWAKGTVAIRTHIDSLGPQAAISWPVFSALRDEWAGRIALQGASLQGIEAFRDADASARLAELVADHGGILGAVAYRVPDLDDLLDRVFALAEARGLELDFHADETDDPQSEGLRAIAETALRRRFGRPILVGHCCSLARQDSSRAAETMRLVREAGISVVSLPMCNMYLQDRAPGRTPRWRGIAPVHELRAAGVPVAFASDNCRDPFYAYGDHDMLEVFSQAVRIAHLDHPVDGWADAFTANPFAAMNLPGGRIAPGAPADLILTPARSLHEQVARPAAPRIVLRAGRVLATPLPDYAALDKLMEPA